MKSRVFIALLMLAGAMARADQAPPECDVDYSVRCDCAPIGYYEGFQLYVVEKCLTLENWVLVDKRQYDEADCRQAIKTHPVCQEFKTLPAASK